MNRNREHHVIPAIVAAIGIASLIVLAYIVFSFVAELFSWLFSGPGSGTPVALAIAQAVRIQAPI